MEPALNTAQNRQNPGQVYFLAFTYPAKTICKVYSLVSTIVDPYTSQFTANHFEIIEILFN